MSPPQLASTRLSAADGREPERWMVFLHGILGRRANWRGFARRWSRARPSWGALLVDLREHGESRGFPPPHTVAAAARDLVELLLAEGLQGDRLGGLLGHSFGGKVALGVVDELAARGALHPRRAPLETWMIDSPPGVVTRRGTTSFVLEALEALPTSFASREGFIARLEADGLETGISQWLAMNLEPEDGGLRLGLDLAAIRALIDDFQRVDGWPVLDAGGSGVRFHLVVGGRSTALDAGELRRARAEAEAGRLTLTVLERAGHWVHVDDPDGLLDRMLDVR